MTTFTLTEHLGHSWKNELVGFVVADTTDIENVGVQDETGQILPCQFARNGGGVKVFFVVDELPELGRREYSVIAADTVFTGPTAHECEGFWELTNGLVTVRVPASQQNPTSPPAPVLGVRRGAGGWIGRGRFFLSEHLQVAAVETEITESGPLWLTCAVTYRCTTGECYRVELRLYSGREEIEISESSELLRESHWEFSVREGLAPDTGWTHPVMSRRDMPVRCTHLDAAAAQRGNLGAVQLPAFGAGTAPDDYYYYAFLSEIHADCLAVAGVNNSFWDYPYANQIDIETTVGADTFFRLGITAGHRRWLLVLTSREAVLEAEFFYLNPIHRAIMRYETPLDKVKDYVLEWDDVPAAARPFLVADSAQLEHARNVARDYAPLREYVASLNADLPGDYTYYHAGSHRIFKPDYRNDPATLYVLADDAEARLKQALFLKDVVLEGLKHRLGGMLDFVGHLDLNCCTTINVGRGLRPWAALYDFAAAEGAFSEAERKLAQAMFAFWSYKIDDADYWPADAVTLRADHPRSAHRLAWFPNRQNDWAFYNIDNLPHNFQGDLWSAAGAVALCFPTHPCSRQWVDKTLEYWEAELTEWVFPEGAWLESATYTLNSMKDYIQYCRMLSNAKIRDYFSDERFQRIFRCLAEFLGPYDQQLGCASMPVMGDAMYPNNMCYVLGWMAGLSDASPGYAAMLQDAWRETGEQLVEPGRFGLNFYDFLFLNPELPAAPLKALESRWYHGLGAVLRHAQGTPEEIYLFLKSGIIYSHFHEPEGTFQLWWHGVPLCDEYGAMYGAGTAEPRAHNCVDVCPSPTLYNKGDITTFVSTPEFDYVVTEAPIQNAYLPDGVGLWGFKGEMGPAGWHRRSFLFMKPYYLFIYDEMESPYPSKYHLNIKADSLDLRGEAVHYDGRFGVDLEFLALDLKGSKLQHGEFEAHEVTPGEFVPPPRFYHQLQVTIEGEPYQDYATVLLPHRKEEAATLEADDATGGARLSFDGKLERAMLFPTVRHVEDEDVIYHGKAGAIREAAGTLTLLQARGSCIGRKGQLVIEGDGPFAASLTTTGLGINTQGIARWLLIEGRAFNVASCDGQAVPLEKAGGKTRVFVPAGSREIRLRN